MVRLRMNFNSVASQLLNCTFNLTCIDQNVTLGLTLAVSLLKEKKAISVTLWLTLLYVTPIPSLTW